jgi:poly-gamma-glutamate system protein
VNRWLLVALAVVAVAMFAALTRTARRVRSPLYEVKLAAARLAEQAFTRVREERDRLGVPVDSVNDPNRTGLVGLHSSALTSGRSDLSDALTTTNPNFAAALVEMLWKAGARRGDSIAASWDGTYPALNIGLLAAAKTLDLALVATTAQSSGAWGANCPGLSWLDIERLLAGSGLWTYRSQLASLGGGDDNGRGLPPDGRALLAAAAESAGVPLVTTDSLPAAVAGRVAIMERCRLLVAVGRAAVNSGDPAARIPSGVLRRRSAGMPAAGLVGTMLGRHKAVIHLANPSEVAISYELPVAPVPLPPSGAGRLFHERRLSVVVAAVFAVLLLALLAFVVRYDVESYLGAPADAEEREAV